MQGFAAAGQAEEVTLHAHSLARLARNVGLMRLSRATAELEGAIASGSGELAARLLVIRSLLFTGLDELRNWRPPAPVTNPCDQACDGTMRANPDCSCIAATSRRRPHREQ